MLPDYVYDLAQLVHQTNISPVTVIGHSLGGMISLQYAGLYPQNVKKIVAIEGLGMPPKKVNSEQNLSVDTHLVKWVGYLRKLSGRRPHRYKSIPDAVARMTEANQRLTAEQAHHLTIHGVNQNEDGTFSWKFDNYLNVWPVVDLDAEAVAALWEGIKCPVLLLWGKDSFFSSPAKDGRIEHFQDARLIEYENAGHWLHHDQFDRFMADVRSFLT